MPNKINVLITGVGGGSFGLEIMKALRLSNIQYNICGTDMSPHSLGFYKADKKYIVPRASDEKYLETILNICEKESIDIIFPGSEPDLMAISNNRSLFLEKDILLAINSEKVIEICMDKSKTFAYLEKMGIRIPKTYYIKSLEDLNKIDYFPVVIKPLKGGGSRNTFIAQDYEELFFFCDYIKKYGSTPIIQEYIGSPYGEYTVGVFSDLDGEIISSVAIKRSILSGLSNRITIKSLKNNNEILAISSGISQGEIVNQDEIIGQCEKISKIIDSNGPINIQCRVKDEHIYPFEINPRFSGTTFMRALAGINEPDLFVKKNLLNEKINSKIYPKYGFVLRGLEEMFIES